MNRSLYLASAAWLFTCTAHAAALEDVVVTAKRLEESLPQELAQYGSRLTVVSHEQIANADLDWSQLRI